MRWIDMDEKDMIKAWAREEYTQEIQMQYLTMPDCNAETYWQKYDNENNIVEFAFHDIPELISMLKDAMSGKEYEDLVLPLAVAAFKEQKKLNINAHERNSDDGSAGLENGSDDEFVIPEFVYVF